MSGVHAVLPADFPAEMAYLAPESADAGAVQCGGGDMARGEAVPRISFGELLRRCRRACGLSQEELAERAGVGVRTICDLERGRTTRPYRRTVGLLAEALGLSGHQRDDFARLSRHGWRETAAEDQTGAGEVSGPPAPEKTADGRPDIPRQLPAAVSYFTGRSGELDWLTGMLSEGVGTKAVVVSAVAGT